MTKQKESTTVLKPKTENQENYIAAIVEHDITFCTGPAGTGKTAVAIGLACAHLLEGKVENIKVVRPAVETSEKGLGFLPGDLYNKLDPYIVNIREEMIKFLGRSAVASKIQDGTIEIAALEYMRGRNFHSSICILDEAQNCTLKQIKMFITRMGRESRMIINGDVDQSDLDNSGLEDCKDRLADLENVAIIQLTTKDIIRNKKLAPILARLERK